MATKTKRNKPDEFFSASQYGDPIADGIHHSIIPVDKIATDMELKWGCERLPGLVSPATASKFGSAKAKLDQAILDNDPTAVAKRSTVMVKGWKAMDDEATQNGYKPLVPKIWSHTTKSGFMFAVARGNADAIKALRTRDDMEGIAVYSLDEIGMLLESKSMALVNAIKNEWPGSAVAEIKGVTKGDMNDECPF